MKENSSPSMFPQEMPQSNSKELKHGVIVDVVTNEINPPHSQNPMNSVDTDSINTEFAKKAQQREQQG